jgi:hypothetical protein
MQPDHRDLAAEDDPGENIQIELRTVQCRPDGCHVVTAGFRFYIASYTLKKNS